MALKHKRVSLVRKGSGKTVSEQALDMSKFPGLPTEKKGPITEFLLYTTLLYGREGVGKTKTFSTFPNALFLSTEPGTKGLKVFEYNAAGGGCKSWEYILAACELLEKTEEFDYVVMDTVDRAYDMAMDYVCAKLGIDYPGRTVDDQEDFGKSWKKIRQEFLRAINRIVQTGRGVGFTSHAIEEDVKRPDGSSYHQIRPTMSKQARKVVEPLVDFAFYCDYVRGADNKVHRVMFTKATEMVFAKERELPGQAVSLPAVLPVTPDGGYEILEAAFSGKNVGLDPRTLMPPRNASPIVQKFMAQQHKLAHKSPSAVKTGHRGVTLTRKGG